MDLKLKELIFKDIIRRIDSKFEGNYGYNSKEINNYFYSLYGKKEEELLDALIDYYYKYAFKIKLPLEQFIKNLLDFGNGIGFNPNLVGNLMLNNKINNKLLTTDFIYSLTKKIKNKELFIKFLNDHNALQDDDYGLFYLLKLIVSGKPFINDQELIDIFKNKFNSLDDNLKEIFIIDISSPSRNKIIEKVPKEIKNEFIKYIHSLSFADQANISHLTYGELPREFYSKLHTLDSDYKIIGSPQGRNKLMIIQKKNEKLYGYINGEGKVIIPPLFDEVSYVTSDGKIRALADTDRGDIKAGIYHIDQDGKIIKIVKEF
jgi:hypothetical protein